MFITAQCPRLRNDLYCVEWDVKFYYTIPYLGALVIYAPLETANFLPNCQKRSEFYGSYSLRLYHLTYGEYFKLLLTPWIAQCHCYCHQKMPGPPQTVVVYNRRVEMIVLAVRSQRRQVLLCFIVDIYRY